MAVDLVKDDKEAWPEPEEVGVSGWLADVLRLWWRR